MSLRNVLISFSRPGFAINVDTLEETASDLDSSLSNTNTVSSAITKYNNLGYALKNSILSIKD